MKNSIAVFLILIGTAIDVLGEKPAAEITVGAYVNRIEKIDLPRGQARCNLWVWLISADQGSKCFDTLEFCNGSAIDKSLLVTKAGEKAYMAGVMTVSASCKYTVFRYPFDQQKITFSFEDSESERADMVFKVDDDNSSFNSEFMPTGWHAIQFRVFEDAHKYQTNFGEISSSPESEYSRFNVELTLVRDGTFFQKFLKNFWAIIIACSVCFITLWIRPSNLAPRFGLSSSSLFAAVAAMFMMHGNLPATANMTIAEYVYYFSIFTILTTITVSAFSLRLYQNDRIEASHNLDKITKMTLLPTYFIVVLTLTMWANYGKA